MKRLLAWTLPTVLLLGLVGWRFTTKRAEEGQQKQTQGARRNATPAVELASARSASIVESLEAVGSVESPNSVQLSPKVSGRIEYLTVREGDRVTPGQVLIRIDPTELEAQVLEQQANLSEARSRLAQARFGQGTTAATVRGTLEQQRAGLTSAEADAAQAQRSYEAEVAAAQAEVADVDARIKAAEAAVRNAEAELARDQTNLKNVQTRLTRLEQLLEKGFVAEQAVDDARAQADAQASTVNVAVGRVDAAKSSVQSVIAQRAQAVQQLEVVRRKGQAEVAAARARVIQARSAVNVAAANQAQNPAYAENLSALQSAVRSAEAQVSQAQARLRDSVLRSPIQGSVTSRSLDPGALASPGQPIVTVQFLDWVYLNASIPVNQVGSVREGQNAEVRFDAYPGRTFKGRVTHINPSADPKSRQFGISVRLSNPGQVLKPGMYGRVALVEKTVHADVMVPREAVKESPAGTTVTVVDSESVAHVRKVKTGVSSAQGVQILEGVSPGDQVVVLSYQPVRDGQKVRVGGGQGGGTRGGQGAPRTGGQPQ